MKSSELSLKRRLRYGMLRLVRFVRLDMWRLEPHEVSPPLRIVMNVIKVVYKATLSFIDDHLMDKASALTYSTVLSIVPMLAVIVGIAKGFGLQNVVRDALQQGLPSHAEELDRVFVYVENYLGQVQGGLFIGIGMIILLYTVLMLISSIEDTLNAIWQAPSARPWSRRIFDYLGLFLLLPVLITASSIMTLAISTIRGSQLRELPFFTSLLEGALGLVPFVLSVLLFVGMYMYLPNVRVRFVPALISGVLAGIAYQAFQSLYIGGVIWISRYNAIYGSFAAFPLLLLWLQLSWTITLYGAQLCYAIQNIRSFAFDQATMQVSRRYLDFVTLLVLSRIVQRFTMYNAEPYTASTLSEECKIPLRMTGSVLGRLSEVGLITTIHYDQGSAEAYYQPAVDPDVLSVGYVQERLDRYGSEDFRIDRYGQYVRHWQAMLAQRGETLEVTPSTLLRDL